MSEMAGESVSPQLCLVAPARKTGLGALRNRVVVVAGFAQCGLAV